jgi:GntR family phosphonate transport system transcriptional regulator
LNNRRELREHARRLHDKQQQVLPHRCPRPARAPRDSFWTRIAADLADAIARGVYPPGQRLPSEHALAEQFGVNRHTIRRSLADLIGQGLLRATQGSGTYVEEFAVDIATGQAPAAPPAPGAGGLARRIARGGIAPPFAPPPRRPARSTSRRAARCCA